MKRIIAMLLACSILLCGCTAPMSDSAATPQGSSTSAQPASASAAEEQDSIASEALPDADSTADLTLDPTAQEAAVDYPELDDPELLRYIEDSVYAQMLTQLPAGKYFIDNIHAVYVSKEYLDEMAYNAQSNIYFGYSLQQLNDQFQGTRYVFTLSDDGKTQAVPMEKYDDTYAKAVKNVAIGTGVILICVAVSALAPEVGIGQSVSIVLAASAKTGTVFALSSGAISAVVSALTTGIQTGNFEEAMKAGALAGSESFKWGAFCGVLLGGAEGAAQVYALKGADVTANGLTLKEAAKIQNGSKYPLDVIRQIHSMEEYQVYKDAGLKAVMVNGKTALVQNMDLTYVSELPDGTEVTNLARMVQGYAPLDPVTGEAYQLHHVSQHADATLAVLKQEQHMGNSAILNQAGKVSEIDRPEFAKVRTEFWRYLGKYVFANGGI